MDISSNVPYKVYTDFNGTLYTYMNEHLLKSPLQPCTEILTNDHSCMKTLVYIHRRYPDLRQMNGYLFLQISLTKVYIHGFYRDLRYISMNIPSYFPYKGGLHPQMLSRP